MPSHSSQWMLEISGEKQMSKDSTNMYALYSEVITIAS